MSRRKPDPNTGQPQLTHRERSFVNEYIKNGGNGKLAAIAAGYGAARAEQSAYQVLHRIQVQQQIQERISESDVCSQEVIGTLASFMRGNIAELLDDNGNLDLALVKERDLGHLLKTIACTTREIKTAHGQPPQIARDYRIQLHSPIQAASILARLMGLNRRTSHFESGNINANEPAPPSNDVFDNLANDFPDHLHANGQPESREPGPHPGIDEILDPTLWMEALIKSEMDRQGRSRSEVIQHLIQLRPEAARFIRPDPTPTDDATTVNGAHDSVHDAKAVDDTTPVDDARAAQNIAESESATPVPNPDNLTSPLPQDSSPSSAVSSNPPDGTQILSPEQLKRIADIVRNSRKINTNQCLEDDSHPHRPNAPPKRVPKPSTIPKTSPVSKTKT
jgi:hypothetical protein